MAGATVRLDFDTAKAEANASEAAHQVDVLTKQMRSLQDQMIRLNAIGDLKGLDKAAAKMDHLTSTLDLMKHHAEQAAIPVEHLGPTFEKAATSAAKMGEAKRGVDGLGKSIFNATIAAHLAEKAFDAVVSVVEKLASTAIDAADEHRGLVTSFDALTGQGHATVDMLDQMSERLPFTTKELGTWGKKLAEVGVTDLPSIQRGLLAASAATALMNDKTGEAGDKLIRVSAQLQRGEMSGKGVKDLGRALAGTGVNIDDIAKQLGKTDREIQQLAKSGTGLAVIGEALQDAAINKGGAALKSFGQDFDVIKKKAAETFQHLFDGVGSSEGYREFVGELQSVVRLFQQNSDEGKHMQDVTTSAFSQMFHYVAAFVKEAVIRFIDLETAAIRLYTAFLPGIHVLKKWWRAMNDAGDASDETDDKLGDMVKTVKELADWLEKVDKLLDYGSRQLKQWATDFDKDIAGLVGDATEDTEGATIGEARGRAIASGLADGMKAGAPAVDDAAAAMVKTADDAVRAKAHIRSPSKLFFDLGAFTAAGYADGLTSKHGDVSHASKRMVDSAANATQAGAGSTHSISTVTGHTLNVYPGAIVVQQRDGQSSKDIAEEAIALLFERLGLSQGVGVAA